MMPKPWKLSVEESLMLKLLEEELEALDEWLRDSSISDEIKGQMLTREDKILVLVRKAHAKRVGKTREQAL